MFHHLKNLSPSHVRSSQTERKRGGRVIRSTIWKRIEDLNSEILKNCEILITNILQHSKCLRQNQIYQRIATQPKSVQRFHDCGMSFSIFDMKGSLLPNRNKRLEQTCRRLKLQWFKHSSICNLVRILLSRRGRYSFNRNFYFSILSLIWETVPLILLISGWYFFDIFFNKCRDMTKDGHHAILKQSGWANFFSFLFRKYFLQSQTSWCLTELSSKQKPRKFSVPTSLGGNDWIIKRRWWFLREGVKMIVFWDLVLNRSERII